MGWDSIDDKANPLNQQATPPAAAPPAQTPQPEKPGESPFGKSSVNPFTGKPMFGGDPNSALASSGTKPFGNTPVNPLTGNPMFGVNTGYGKPKLGDLHTGHNANLLRMRLEDGKVKLYTDSKGVAERVEIQMPNGLVVVYKDYGVSKTLAHYKKIEILDSEMQPKGEIELVPQNRMMAHTSYRVFYGHSEIGNASGDVGLLIAQQLVSPTIQVRSGKGSGVDDEVIATIKNIMNSKR